MPLVLMGHSHNGVIARNDEVVYANSGCFLDGSHLVVRRDPSGRLEKVELRAWRNDAVVVLDAAPYPRPHPRAPATRSSPTARSRTCPLRQVLESMSF
ncbi:hypothetical protein [Nannocystis pusilla]|uniref:hypothetical protein n=1 Tax=Nannocystis pusilla TaxID=889268 RepID=UPI003B776D7C